MERYKLYEVGGCIRDRLLGVKSKDIDYAFEYTPHMMESKLTPRGFYNMMNSMLKGQGFEIFLETPDCFTTRARFPQSHSHAGLTADFVMCRKETYQDVESRQPTVQIGNLYDDLQRRDFTVNAMAEDENGNLIDPFGGQEDLKNMILRCPIDAETSFKDDPLRMIRALRFMVTKDLDISEDIKQAFLDQEIWKKFDLVVSKERVREELYKMFKHNTSRSWEVLNDTIHREFLFEYVFKNGFWLKPTNEK